MDHLHWRHLLAKPYATATRTCRNSHMTVHALATLGVATQDHFYLCHAAQGGQGK